MTSTRTAPIPPGARPAASGRSHEDLLLRRARTTGDPHSRARAIEAYMPLARRIAQRYANGSEPLEDLMQVAYLGLVKAIDRFDPDAGTRFASFAIPTIAGELRRHFRDTTWSVHVPRGMQEAVLRVRGESTALTERLGRAPTVGELAKATGLDVEEVAEALQARTARDTSSLDAPMPGADDDAGSTLADTLGCEEDGFELADDRASLSPHLRALPPRDRELLFLRFARDMTQTEIAERLGCSQMQVSRLLRRALAQLAAAAGETPAPS